MSSNKKRDLNEWFHDNFNTPKAILVEYLNEINSAAALVGATLPSNFLEKLVITDRISKSHMIYLPSISGTNDQKQYAFAFLGTLDYKTHSIPVPLITFSSFKLSINSHTWSPSRSLIDDFKRYKNIASYGIRKSSESYEQTVANLKAIAKEQDIQNEKVIQEANKAARNLSFCQTRKSLVQTIEHPSEAFGIEGLTQNSLTEFICTRSASSKLFVTSKHVWKQCVAAYPRDIIIPMYDICTGQLSNLQVIRKLSKSTQKRFLPGGKMLNQCTIISPEIINNSYIITEGYKTGRVLEETKVSTVICAFSAKNVPNIVKELRRREPSATIFTATDNDKDGQIVEKICKEQYNSIPIPPPRLFKGSDWADLACEKGLNVMVETFKSLISSIKTT